MCYCNDHMYVPGINLETYVGACFIHRSEDLHEISSVPSSLHMNCRNKSGVDLVGRNHPYGAVSEPETFLYGNTPTKTRNSISQIFKSYLGIKASIHWFEKKISLTMIGHHASSFFE